MALINIYFNIVVVVVILHNNNNKSNTSSLFRICKKTGNPNFIRKSQGHVAEPFKDCKLIV